MPDYQKTKIYKIMNNENDKFYIGHTVQKLSERMRTHRNVSSYYKCSSNNLGVDIKDCFIVLVEKYPCKDIDEARKRERYYIEKYKKEGLNIVNIKIPGRTDKEYQQLPIVKQKSKSRAKKHYQDNKSIHLNNSKKRYKNNKEEIKKTRKEKYKLNKEKHAIKSKKYRDENIEKIKKNNKDYYQNNKNLFLKKINCVCGSKHTLNGTIRHKETQKHKVYEFLSLIENSI